MEGRHGGVCHRGEQEQQTPPAAMIHQCLQLQNPPPGIIIMQYRHHFEMSDTIDQNFGLAIS